MRELDAIPPARRTGDECFHHAGATLGLRIRDFWQWAASDLLSNSMRGVLAEFLVAAARELRMTPRVEWDAVDLVMPDGTRIEVKSGAYVQSWQQRSHSTIRFNIAPRFGWDAATNSVARERERHSHVYVFCVLAERDQAKIDPLDLAQWQFCVVPTSLLAETFGGQKTVGLRPLVTRLSLVPVRFPSLRSAIAAAAVASRDAPMSE